MAEKEPDQRLNLVWGLQGFTVQFVDFEEFVDRSGRLGRRKIVGLRDLRGYHECSQCGRQHLEGAFQEAELRLWRDCSLGDAETFVVIRPWRVACCGGTRVESFPWEAAGHRMTIRFFERIAAL